MKSLQLHKPVFSYADMVELADTPDLGSGALRRTGSSPAIRTSREPRRAFRARGFSFCYGFMLAVYSRCLICQRFPYEYTIEIRVCGTQIQWCLNFAYIAYLYLATLLLF